MANRLHSGRMAESAKLRLRHTQTNKQTDKETNRQTPGIEFGAL